MPILRIEMNQRAEGDGARINTDQLTTRNVMLQPTLCSFDLLATPLHHGLAFLSIIQRAQVDCVRD